MAEARKTFLVRILKGAGGADAILARSRLLQFSDELLSRRCANFNRSPRERPARRTQGRARACSFSRAPGDASQLRSHNGRRRVQISTPWKSSGGGPGSASARWIWPILKAKRRSVQRTALKARVRSLVASGSAKLVAKNYAIGSRKVCEEVRRKKGAATRG